VLVWEYGILGETRTAWRILVRKLLGNVHLEDRGRDAIVALK
jgi:hypothetical protein